MMEWLVYFDITLVMPPKFVNKRKIKWSGKDVQIGADNDFNAICVIPGIKEAREYYFKKENKWFDIAEMPVSKDVEDILNEIFKLAFG